jgi:D-alanyl-D-alanine carboxypeptidase
MAMQNVCEFLRRWKAIVAGLTLIFAMTAVTSIPADARRHHGHYHGYHHRHHGFHNRHHVRRHTFFRRHPRHHHARSESGESPGFAAIVVDANSGRTLFARNENAARHPASVTKVMTLYLLFEQLERGRIRLNSPLTISAHAAAQAPSKLGLRPGETIDVENAIKAVVTKSANDIAVAIAENIGGDEDSFAEMMTRKAHSLGMSHTHYANASGLPNSEQITTAHDLAILGRAIQDRFPKYYRYFSTHVFAYHGAHHRNHNHLLGRIEGVDGIKTGYTRASGFNLLTSVHRDGHHIVAVVLGGRSAATRDRIMAGLIEDHIEGGSTARTARAIAEDAQAERPSQNGSGAARADEEDQEEGETPTEPSPSRPEKTAPLAYFSPEPLTPPASIQPTHSADARDGKIRPAFVPGGRAAFVEEPKRERPRHAETSTRPRIQIDGSTTGRASGQTPRVATATTPSNLKHAEAEPARTLQPKSEVSKTQVGRPARTGWMVQIGATEDVKEAGELLARARGVHTPLASAKAFTEKVQKGKDTLWRARFAGLEEQDAETACKSLKRSGFACFATKN